MARFNPIARFLIVLVLVTQTSAWRGGYIQLINATPYEWKLNETTSSGMHWDFPKTVSSGSSHEQHFEYTIFRSKNSGSATYILENAPKPMSFTIKFVRQPLPIIKARIDVQYSHHLQSHPHPPGWQLHLGFVRDSSVLFTLAGSNAPFSSSTPPPAWMQASLGTLSQHALRELCLPASNDAAMSTLNHYHTLSRPSLTPSLSQTKSLYSQLYTGARHFTMSPVFFRNDYFAGKYKPSISTNRLADGATGVSFADMIRDINTFNRRYPGELIILDLTHALDATRQFKPFREQEWIRLYAALSGIHDLWVANASHTRFPLPHDISTLPTSAFIQKWSRSAVLVRVPDGAPGLGIRGNISVADISGPLGDLDIGGTGAVWSGEEIREGLEVLERTTAFLTAGRMPQSGEGEGAESLMGLARGELDRLRERGKEMFMSVWRLKTDPLHPLTAPQAAKRAILARRALYQQLWSGIVGSNATLHPPPPGGEGRKRGKYPNLLQVNDYVDDGVTALCMAINEWFLGMDGGR